MEGYGLNDEETLAWLFQANHPELDVRNGGVGGYGTCQSFLAMRYWLKQTAYTGGHVVYGFIEHHEDRNVVAPSWVWNLAVISSLGNAYAPYCRVTELGRLEVVPAHLQYPNWPLQSKLNTVAVIQFIADALSRWGVHKTKRQVTGLILEQMHALARSKQAEFDVLFLEGNDEAIEEYKNLLNRKQIGYADCRHPQSREPGFVIEGDPVHHPNEIVNQYWLDCVEKAKLLR